MRTKRTIQLMLLLCLASGCGAIQSGKGIDNFGTVDDGPRALYRGAQPTRDAGIKLIRDKKVQTVIDLRYDAESWEAPAVRDEGMNYICIETKAWAVEPKKIKQFLHELRTRPRPIFVHCLAGRDRTGLGIAIYRIVDQGWTRQAAIKELHAHRYNWLLYPGIEKYIRTFNPADFEPAPSDTREATVLGN